MNQIEIINPVAETTHITPVAETTHITPVAETTQQKKRKNVENNGIELLVAILLSNESVQTTEQLFTLLDQLKESMDNQKLVCD